MMTKTILFVSLFTTLGGPVSALESNTEIKGQAQIEERIEMVSEQTKTETEQDIYAKNDENDSVKYLPMKAWRMQYQGIEYFLLTDGNGTFTTTTEQLEDGENYQVLYSQSSDRIYKIEKYNFEFTYEDVLESEKNDFVNRGADRFIKNNVISL